MESNEKKYYEQQKTVIFIIGIVVIILIFIILFPLAIQWLIDRDSTHKGSDDGWLGFWGGYLGAIIGVVGAFVVLKYQLRKDQEKSRAERTDNTFFNLLNMFIAQQNDLVSEQNSERDLFEDMLNKIEENSMFAYRKQGLVSFYKEKSKLLILLDRALNASEKFVDSNTPTLTKEECDSLEVLIGYNLVITKPDSSVSQNYEDVILEVMRIRNIQKLKEAIKNETFYELLPNSSEALGVNKLLSDLNMVMYRNKLLDTEDVKYVMQVYDDLKEYTKVKPNIELEIIRKKKQSKKLKKHIESK